MHGLVGGDDVARHQVGERDGVDVEALGAGVVALARVLVDAVAAVGDDDQVGIAAVADGDVDAVDGGRVRVAAGAEGGTAVDAGQQQVVAADDAVQRQIDVVLPLAGRRLGAEVADGELQARAGAGGDAVGRLDVGDAQVGAVVELDRDRVGVGRRLVVARA
ncbi:MAG: hypothetical protein JF617_08160, partial [Burkholderiales bacterium]|nr:hypothetical protein [Burkholderiales bacterium]